MKTPADRRIMNMHLTVSPLYGKQAGYKRGGVMLGTDLGLAV